MSIETITETAEVPELALDVQVEVQTGEQASVKTETLGLMG